MYLHIRIFMSLLQSKSDKNEIRRLIFWLVPPAAGGLFLIMVKGVEFIREGERVFMMSLPHSMDICPLSLEGEGGGYKNILVVKLGGYLPNFLEVLSRQKNRTLVLLIVSVFSGFVSTN